MHDGGSVSILQSLLKNESLSLSLLEKLIGTWSQGLSSGRGMKDSGSSRELKETMLYTGRKAWPSRQDGEEHLISRNWETGWEEEGCLEKVAFFGLSKHLWIHTSFSINPSLWRETTCRTVWILIFHTFPCKQKHTGMFRHFWYLERNKWEPLAVKLYWHSDIPFSSH